MKYFENRMIIIWEVWYNRINQWEICSSRYWNWRSPVHVVILFCVVFTGIYEIDVYRNVVNKMLSYINHIGEINKSNENDDNEHILYSACAHNVALYTTLCVIWRLKCAWSTTHIFVARIQSLNCRSINNNQKNKYE